MARTPKDCWETADMIIELHEAIKHISHYIGQTPPKYDKEYWVKVKKRLQRRRKKLEKLILIGELDVEHWYGDEAIRKKMVDYLTIQGVFKK